MVMPFDLHHATCFATIVAARMEHQELSEDDIAAIEAEIEREGWIEPPRWRPYAEIAPDQPYFEGQEWRRGDVYRIWLCPGAVDQASLTDLIAAKPPGMHGECTIGPVFETADSLDDPRLDPTPSEKAAGRRARYTTVVNRLVNAAYVRGLLLPRAPSRNPN